jgi:hypothetical protein
MTLRTSGEGETNRATADRKVIIPPAIDNITATRRVFMTASDQVWPVQPCSTDQLIVFLAGLQAGCVETF